MADNDTALEKAARAVHETYKGKGTWSAATPAERSKARHAVRLAQSALGADGGRSSAGAAKKYW
ncbi:MAG: hypothetical protein EOP20_13075 [Hyphomicrobiales bacterium]|nr:MAG: hypothetical protein EOP20_13075 [Hyphomicrobiales bacterium]